jgi:hypothetical protein
MIPFMLWLLALSTIGSSVWIIGHQAYGNQQKDFEVERIRQAITVARNLPSNVLPPEAYWALAVKAEGNHTDNGWNYDNGFIYNQFQGAVLLLPPINETLPWTFSTTAIPSDWCRPILTNLIQTHGKYVSTGTGYSFTNISEPGVSIDVPRVSEACSMDDAQQINVAIFSNR